MNLKTKILRIIYLIMFSFVIQSVFTFFILHTTQATEQVINTTLENSENTTLTLDEYFDGMYSPEEFEGSWVEGSDHLIKWKTDNEIIFFDVETGENETILEFSEVTDHWSMTVEDVIFSSDRKYALIKAATPDEWKLKNTPCTSYVIFDMETRESRELGEIVEINNTEQLDCIQTVTWTPTGNGIVYVAHNNIYYIPDVHNSIIIYQITHDGNEELGIYNGITAWHARSGDKDSNEDLIALWISPNSTHIAFSKYDDSSIPEIQVPYYGDPDSEPIYTTYRKFRYPKAGYNISKHEVYLVNLEDSKLEPKKLKFASDHKSDIYLIGTAYWITKSKLLVPTFNRHQTIVRWHICRVKSSTCKEVYTYAQSQGWLHEMTAAVSDDGTRFISNRPVKLENDTVSYMHIVMININGSEKVVTSGKLSVIEMLAWDVENDTIYFSGTFWNGVAADPSESHIYSVSAENKYSLHCITCGLTNSAGKLCRANSALFSEDFQYFIHSCDGPDVPEVTTRHTDTGGVVEHPGPTSINNSELRAVLEKKQIPVTKGYLIPLDNGFVARARLYIPKHFDKNKKYPLLVNVYAGPGSQSISQEYHNSWDQTLVSDKEVIVAFIDGRGSGRQSTDVMFAVHRRLGTIEVQDQISATKWLIANEPLIHPNKTCIWGGSYGGYVAAKVLETDTENIFKCGISVAPVTNWRHYDAVYTESYMGLPTEEDNLKGYNDADLTTTEHVQNLRDKEFLLVHGTADDTVLYQNSMLLARALQKNGIFFQQLTYPDEGHAMETREISKHMHHSLEKFLLMTYIQLELMERVKKVGEKVGSID